MNDRHEFPQYYHVEDLYGNVFAVVCKESDTSFTVIQKRDVRKSFIVSKVTSEADVKEIAPGQLLGASPKDYQDVLSKEFGFDLSDDAINATLKQEVKPNVEKSVLEDDGDPRPAAGQDVQSSSGTDPAASVEQPAIDKTEHDTAPSESATGTEGSGAGDGEGSVEDAGKGDEAPSPKPAHDAGTDPKPVSKNKGSGKVPQGKSATKKAEKK